MSLHVSDILPDATKQELQRIPHYLRLLNYGKKVLAIVFLSLVAAVMLLPLLNSKDDGVRISILQEVISEETELTVSNDQPVMKNPRYEGVDAKNQPFTIRAKEAIQQDSQTVILKSISADMTLENDLWIALTAGAGTLKLDDSTMNLHQNAHLIASNGYEFLMPSAHVDMKSHRIESRETIHGQGPAGTIQAQRMTLLSDKSSILFEGNVKLTLYP